MTVLRLALRVALLLFVLQLAAAPAAAHDCASQQDCEETSGYLAGIGLVGGIIAIVAGLLGNDLGSRPAPSGPTVTTEAEPQPAAPTVAVAPPPLDVQPPLIAAAQPAPAEPAPAPAGPGDGEIEIPWDDLITADDPNAGGRSGTDDLQHEPGVELPTQPGPGGEVEVPWDDLIKATEPATPGADPDDEALAGDPAVDADVPPEEPVEEPEPATAPPAEEPAPPESTTAEKPERTPAEVEGTPKPPGLETAEKIAEIGGNVKDAADKVKEHLDQLGLDEDTKKKIEEKLGDIADKAGTAKEYAEKAQEYINALDENLTKTKQLGVNEQSRDFLGWWRVTFKAAGELTEKFVHGLTSPVTSLFGEKGGEKATEFIDAVVPVKEFGEELSKLPTSAAEHVVKAQNRDQGDQLVAAAPKGDPFHDDLEGLYPSDWSKVK